MSRIDRIRRAALVRRAQKAEDKVEETSAGPGAMNLPVPTGAAPRTFRDERPQGYVEVAAQLLGQAVERRGLRAGPPLFDAARDAYNRVEWSGSYDRRARKGRRARTDI
jgi:hypothetical protein